MRRAWRENAVSQSRGSAVTEEHNEVLVRELIESVDRLERDLAAAFNAFRSSLQSESPLRAENAPLADPGGFEAGPSLKRAGGWHRLTRRYGIRRTLRPVTATLILIAGLLAVSESAVTVLWQEPLSAFSAWREQHKLNGKLAEAEAAALAGPARFAARTGPDSSRAAVLARRLGRHTPPGQPLGRIRIPKLDIKFVFVQGVSADDLEKGPGHYGGTALPGQRGTVGIAGHRTTYLAPFRHLDQLARGDEVELKMPYGRFVYSIERSMVVSPTNATGLRGVRHDRLVLTTCTPPFSASKRLVVVARFRSGALEDRNSPTAAVSAYATDARIRQRASILYPLAISRLQRSPHLSTDF
jgi:sortase A